MITQPPVVDTQTHEQFFHERSRLLSALGELAEGGIVEQLQHIGSSSVPGMSTSGCIDIGLSIWPFPLDAHRQAALEALGYQLRDGRESKNEQRFQHANGVFQLCIAEAGDALWTDYLILRDYLRENESARQAYTQRKQNISADQKAQLIHETLVLARTWWIEHHGFVQVQEVADELKELSCPWSISSGWALDLFLNCVTRVHHDVDVVIARTDQLVLQSHMTERGWKFLTPFQNRLEAWPPAMRIELPRHQAHALRDGAFIDFLIGEIEHGVWRYRRDPIVMRNIERMYMRSANGIPFLAPELVLLFKSKNTSNKERDKDQKDFEEVLPSLEPERRAWLRWALLASDPEHAWIDRLA